jgi:uncharacterized membrane protein YfcA
MWGYRREIEESRPLLVGLGLPSLAGGAIGTLLLIYTPTAVFTRLVPFLILFATGLFTLQEPVSRRLRLPSLAAGAGAKWWTGAVVFQFMSSIYGGYFGAGNSILVLAALGLLGLSDIHKANGVKNFLGACINSVAVLGFAVSGLVNWPVALLMALGAIAGGYVAARIARWIGRAQVRRAVVLIGLIIGFVMLWQVGR